MVKNYSILYDLADEDYKNIRKKDKVWQHLGLELGENGEELKKKWKNLRDSYAKHLRSLKTTTGQSARQKLYKWQWAKQMEQFRPFMSFAKTELNISDLAETQNTIDTIDTTTLSSSTDIQQDEHIVDVEEHNILNETDKTPSEVTSISLLKDQGKAIRNKRTKKSELAQEESPTAAVIKYLKEKPKYNNYTSDTDAIDLIFLGYAKIVKTFSPRLQVTAKLKLAELMSHLELEHQQERTDFLAFNSSTRCSSAVSNTTGYTTPLLSPTFSETRDSAHDQGTTSRTTEFQVIPVRTGTLQTNLNLNQEEMPFTPLINQPYVPNTHSKQSNEIDYQTNQGGMTSSLLFNYVNNFNPN